MARVVIVVPGGPGDAEGRRRLARRAPLAPLLDDFAEGGFANADGLVKFVRSRHDFCIGVAGYPEGKTLVPHGMAVVLNNPSVWRYTAPCSPERHLRAASCLGAADAAVHRDDQRDADEHEENEVRPMPPTHTRRRQEGTAGREVGRRSYWALRRASSAASLRRRPISTRPSRSHARRNRQLCLCTRPGHARHPRGAAVGGAGAAGASPRSNDMVSPAVSAATSASEISGSPERLRYACSAAITELFSGLRGHAGSRPSSPPATISVASYFRMSTGASRDTRATSP